MNKREWMLHTASAVLANGQGPLGELEVTNLSLTYDAIVAITPDTDEGWQEWRGEKPYPEGPVDVRFRDGTTDSDDADAYVWSYDGTYPHEDIIAWRPARA